MNSKQKIELLKDRNISTIIMDTLSFVRENFKSLFSGLFYICSPALLVSAVGFFLFFKGYFSALSSIVKNPGMGGAAPYDANTINELLLLIPYLLFLFVCIYIAMCFIISVSYSYVKLYQQNVEITTNLLWDTSKRYIWKIIGSQLILMFVTLIAYVVCCIPILLFLIGENAGIIGVLLTLFLFFIFLAVLLYFYVKFSFYQHFLIVEDKGILESFKLSYIFSKDIFWKTFLSIFVLNLIVSIGGNLFQFPGIIIMFFGFMMGFARGEEQSVMVLLGIALTSLGVIMAYMLYSVSYIGISFIYYSTVENRTGINANKEIESIGKQEEFE